MIYTKTIQALQKELQARYEVSATINHRGEKGRKRENGLSMFLKEYLPEKYGIATGEVIPFRGGVSSPQCDIIVYDRANCPVIGRFSQTQQVPIEWVYAVIEVKSIITRAAIDDSLYTFTQLKSIPRCPFRFRPKPRTMRAPLMALLGYELGTTQKECSRFLAQAKNEELSIVALDTGCSIWIGEENCKPVPIFLECNKEPDGVYDTLALWFSTFVNSLSEIDLGIPSHFDTMLSLKEVYEQNKKIVPAKKKKRKLKTNSNIDGKAY